MNIFIYKPKIYNPIIIAVVKISSDQELNLLLSWTNELFQILIDNNEATTENILIFSIIKDHLNKTSNLILPSTKSDLKLVNKCENTLFINSIISNTLLNSDTKFYIDLKNDKIFLHYKKLNLGIYSKFYLIK